MTWHLQMPDRLPLIQADPVRLRQILLNLMSNARKFMDQGEVVLGAQVEPPHLHLWVQDTGAGISPDMQERIFEPFVTAKKDGTGLGLSISYGIIEAHDGQISATSQEGVGSSFTILLPVSEA